jgi:hypothetical protein
VLRDTDAAAWAAIVLLWARFRVDRRWPSRKEFLLLISAESLSFDAIRNSSAISIGRGAEDTVCPVFEALVGVAEVRALLAPLPAVLRDAANLFVADAPRLPDNQLPILHFNDMKRRWDDPSRALMAVDVMRSTGATFFNGGGSRGADAPDDFWFSLGIDVLQYEYVETLEDVLRVRRGDALVDVGRSRGGMHLDLLCRIYAASKSEQRWPDALSFAVRERDLGYVPHLARELGRRFLRGEFQPSRRHALVLTPDALPLVDPSV